MSGDTCSPIDSGAGARLDSRKACTVLDRTEEHHAAGKHHSAGPRKKVSRDRLATRLAESVNNTEVKGR